MFSSLITSIGTVLSGVSKLAYVYNYPVIDLQGYPSAIFYPVAFDNSYLTNQDNLKGYNFKIFLVCEMTIKDPQTVYNTILAGVVDDVVQAFDTNWSSGTIGGHRAWWTVENGDWYIYEGVDGKQAIAELNLKINIMTNN